MIQRVQSLYILAAFISTLCLFFVPMYSLVPGELSVSGEVFRCGITGVYQVKGGIPELLYSTLPLMLVNGIIGAILIGSILMYKRRTQQVKLVHAALFILLVSNLFQLWSSGTLRGV